MADNDSEHGNNDNENEEVGQPVWTLRDYLQPTRGTTPSYMVMAAGVGQFEIKSGVVQLL